MTSGTDLGVRTERTAWVEDLLRATTFNTALLGYDRHQVDVYLEYVETRMAEYQKDLAELGEACSRLLREYRQPSYAGLGRRARLLLQLAEEEADAIRTAAHRDAERVQADIDRRRAELTTTLARLHAVLTEVPSIDPDRSRPRPAPSHRERTHAAKSRPAAASTRRKPAASRR